MIVYVVLYDRLIGYNDCCETEIVGVFRYQIDAKRYARNNDNYRIEKWAVSGMQTES